MVRQSVQLLADSGWYGFVSSISAHPEGIAAGGNQASPIHGPPFPEEEVITDQSYGPLKVACEREVVAGFGDRAAIVRPGFVVGPYDPTDGSRRWSGGRRPVGRCCVRDRGTGGFSSWTRGIWRRSCCGRRSRKTGGVYDVVHPMHTVTWEGVVEAARAVSGADTTFTWMGPEVLEAALGKDAEEVFPLWAPKDQGFHQLDPGRAVAAGLVNRSVVDTVRDTWVWARTARIAARHGLSAEREAELLRAGR